MGEAIEPSYVDMPLGLEDISTSNPLKRSVRERDVVKWQDDIRDLAVPGKYNGTEIVEKLTQLSVMVIADLMMNSSSEKVKMSAAKELAHMGGMKPVERTQHVNVNVMAEAEVNALLMSKLEDFGIKAIDSRREGEG